MYEEEPAPGMDGKLFKVSDDANSSIVIIDRSGRLTVTHKCILNLTLGPCPLRPCLMAFFSPVTGTLGSTAAISINLARKLESLSAFNCVEL